MRTAGPRNETKKQQAARWAYNWFEKMCQEEEEGTPEGYKAAKESYYTWCQRAGIDPT